MGYLEDSHPHFDIVETEGGYHDEDMLMEALEGLKSLEGHRVDETLGVQLRYYKKMIEKAGYKCSTNTTLTDIKQTWSVEDIRDYHERYVPENFRFKDSYSRIEVNNMLFDLCSCGIIRGYSDVALPYPTMLNSEVFDDYVDVLLRVED